MYECMVCVFLLLLNDVNNFAGYVRLVPEVASLYKVFLPALPFGRWIVLGKVILLV